VRSYAHPVWDEKEERLTHIYGAVKDISAERQALQKIQQLNTELEERVALRTSQLEDALTEMESFSYTISHDLRAPLRAVDGYAHMLLEEETGRLDEMAVTFLTNIHENAGEMADLIDGLLAFIRVGHLVPKKEIVHPDVIARMELKKLIDASKELNVDVVIADMPACESDPEVLSVTFRGLISNALKFSRKRERLMIEIGCRQDERETIYWVRDHGAGFDMRHTDKLFGIFQRLHHQDEFEGRGLSLAIIRRLIQRQGGRIWAESEVDKGATFYFTLK